MTFLDPSLGTDLLVNVGVGVAGLLVGLSPIGTKIMDAFKGIPSDVRTALNDVETSAIAKVKAAAVKAPVKKPTSPAAALVASAAAAVAAPATPAPTVVAAVAASGATGAV